MTRQCRQSVLSLFVASLFIALAAPIEADDSLTLRVAEPNHVAGEYARDGVVIRFDSELKTDGARLEIRDGTNALLVTNTIHDGTLSISFLGDRLRVVERLSAPDDEAQTEPEITGDENGLRELLERAEYKALPYLSRALGARSIGGDSHPAALPLHLIAKASARAHKFSFDTVVSEAPAAESITSESISAVSSACYDQRGDPCNDDCFGMCGAVCNCWPWVCGDCCINKGCLEHDVWCDDYICSGSKASGAKCYGGPLLVYGAAYYVPGAAELAYLYGCRYQSQPCTDKRTCDPDGEPDPRCERGIRSGNVCCVASCGTCGGEGCGQRNGGGGACCMSNIQNDNRSCNKNPAPCVIDLSNLPDPRCERGIRSGNVCCAASCGTCGGEGCGERNGGGDACCTSIIQSNDRSCNRYPAPCVIDTQW